MKVTRNNAGNPIQRDEMSIKELVLKLQEWSKYLFRYWVIILLCGLLGGALGFLYAYLAKPAYTAELDFVIEESKSSGLGAYAGLASQFGIDLGSAGTSGVFAGDNILIFLKTRFIVEKALTHPIKINNNNKYVTLADLYIDIYNLKKGWVKKPALRNINFPVGLDRSKYSLDQDSILNVLFLDITKKRLDVNKPDKKMGFILVKCTTGDQLFSKFFVEQLVNEALTFYVETKTKQSKSNVDRLQRTADSLEILLNRKTYSAAVVQDLNANPAKRITTVGGEVATRDKLIIQTVYGEVIKNLEMSRMAMAQETPLMQIVDKPILPLLAKKPGKAISLIVGGMLGGILILIVLVLRRIYIDTLD